MRKKNIIFIFLLVLILLISNNYFVGKSYARIGCSGCGGSCSGGGSCGSCDNDGCYQDADGVCKRACKNGGCKGENCSFSCSPCGNGYTCGARPTEPPQEKCYNNKCTNRSCDHPKCSTVEVPCPGGSNECPDGGDRRCRPDDCGPTDTPGPTRTPTPTQPPPPTATSTPPPPTNTPTPKPTATILTGYPTTAPRDTGLPGSGTGKSWTCINPVNPQPAGLPQGEFELFATNFPAQSGTPVYIVGCILEKVGVVSKGFKCTTGNTNVDQILRIQKSADHTFAVIRPPFNPPTPPITVPSSKEFTARVKSNVPYTTIHTFYGIYNSTLFDPGGQGALHYGTFDWRQDFAKCVPILWDPYGRVFDSQSLEPLPNIQVNLLDQNKNKVIFTGTSNPATTDTSGSFNFYAGPGIYYLEPKLPSGYLFSSSPKLNKNYYKAFTNIYKPGEAIIETGSKAEERDIPFDPGSNRPYRSNLTQLSFDILPISQINKTKVIGQVSHPLTLVTIYQQNKKLGETRANKYGYFEVNIDNNKIIAGIPLSPSYTKVDLTKDEVLGVFATDNNLLTKIMDFINIIRQRTTAANSSQSVVLGASVNPLPRYVEGYIYDKTGNIVKNAKVEVILSMSEQPYFETAVNNSGLLIINTSSLPIFNYYFKITPKNSKDSFIIITDEFVQKNKEYLEANKINLMVVR